MIKNILTVTLLLSAFCVMLKLGFWQLDRLEWKQDILAKIEQYESVDASKTPLDLTNSDEFQRGYIEGQFTFIETRAIVRPRTNDKGEVGHHLLFPFKVNTGENIIVNMGWYPDDHPPMYSKSARKLTGYLRTPDKKSFFTPQNNPEQHKPFKDQFYYINLDDLEKFHNVELFDKILYLDSAFPTMQKPRNKHTQYATFWFFMSGLLLFLTGVFIWKQRK